MPVYKDKSRGTWYCTYRYTDWDKKSHSTKKRGFATKREALEYERCMLDSRKQRKDLYFGKLFELYLQDRKPRLRDGTIRSIQSIVNIHIMPYFKNRILEDITPALVRKWENEELIAKGYAETTKRVITSKLSAIMNFAVKYYDVDKNPVTIAGTVGNLHDNKRPHVVWEAEDFNKFIVHVKKDLRIFFYILFYTGMRKGELAALTYKDLDGSVLHITKQKVKDGKGRWTVGKPKTKTSVRDIQIPQFLADMIRERQSHAVDCDGEIYQLSPSMFALSDKLGRVSKRIGLERITLHELRHSHASMLISMGLPITTIAKRLGHTPATTLRVYSHAFDSMAETVTQKLQSLYLQGSLTSVSDNPLPPVEADQRSIAS